MKSWTAVVAVLGIALCAQAQAAGVLVPILTSTGQLELFDPTRPVDLTNPQVVETDVLGSPFSVQTARIIRSERVADGLVEPIEYPLVVYRRLGRVFLRDLRLDASHERVRVSSITDACRIQGQVLDAERPVRSWVRIALPGTDGSCSTADDVYRFVRLSMGTGERGVLLPGDSFPSVNYTATGAIAAFFTTGVPSTKLVRRDADFQNPVDIADLDPGDGAFVPVRQFNFAQTFVIAHVAGNSGRGLYRIEETGSGPVLSASLHRFDAGKGGLAIAVSDGTYLYFSDDNQLLRIPLAASSAGEAKRLFTAPVGQNIESIVLSSDDNPRIVFSSYESAYDRRGVYSIRKNGGDLVELATQDPLQSRYVTLSAVNGRHVYLTKDVGLVVADDDGSDERAVTGSALAFIPALHDPDWTSSSFPNVPIADKILISAPGKQAGLANYWLRDAATGKVGCRLGTVDENVGLFPLAEILGRTAALLGSTDGSEDTYVIDLATCGSLRPAAARVDVDEYPVWGF